jgi:hypothetical protein
MAPALRGLGWQGATVAPLQSVKTYLVPAVLRTAARARLRDAIAAGHVVFLLLAHRVVFLVHLLDVRQAILLGFDSLLVLLFHRLGSVRNSWHDQCRRKADASRAGSGACQFATLLQKTLNALGAGGLGIDAQ